MAEPILSGLKSFDGSVRSSVNSTCKTSSLRRFDQQQADVSRAVSVPGIGRALQKSSGTISYYEKNSWLTIQSTQTLHKS